jgi:hypothetical protein
METGCIYATNNDIEAGQVVELLESHGIPTLVKNMSTQNIFGGLKPFAGYDAIAGAIEVHIREDDNEKAGQLLKEFFAEGEDLLEGETPRMDEGDTDKDNYQLPSVMQGKNEKEPSNIKRILYFSLILSALSFLSLPFAFNIFFLIELCKTKKSMF